MRSRKQRVEDSPSRESSRGGAPLTKGQIHGLRTQRAERDGRLSALQQPRDPAAPARHHGLHQRRARLQVHPRGWCGPRRGQRAAVGRPDCRSPRQHATGRGDWRDVVRLHPRRHSRRSEPVRGRLPAGRYDPRQRLHLCDQRPRGDFLEHGVSRCISQNRSRLR